MGDVPRRTCLLLWLCIAPVARPQRMPESSQTLADHVPRPLPPQEAKRSQPPPRPWLTGPQWLMLTGGTISLAAGILYLRGRLLARRAAQQAAEYAVAAAERAAARDAARQAALSDPILAPHVDKFITEAPPTRERVELYLALASAVRECVDREIAAGNRMMKLARHGELVAAHLQLELRAAAGTLVRSVDGNWRDGFTTRYTDPESGHRVETFSPWA